jgi:hypothetical protein
MAAHQNPTRTTSAYKSAHCLDERIRRQVVRNFDMYRSDGQTCKDTAIVFRCPSSEFNFNGAKIVDTNGRERALTGRYSSCGKSGHNLFGWALVPTPT